jgi:hypothetical protein
LWLICSLVHLILLGYWSLERIDIDMQWWWVKDMTGESTSVLFNWQKLVISSLFTALCVCYWSRSGRGHHPVAGLCSYHLYCSHIDFDVKSNICYWRESVKRNWNEPPTNHENKIKTPKLK